MKSKAVMRMVQSFIGFLFGGAMLYLSLRGVPLAAGTSYFRNAAPEMIAAAMCFYAVALWLRSLRWHMLLSTVSRVTRLQVLESLLVGYAFNNALPARIGELLRANYIGRRYNVNRSAVLGSIIIERLFDGVTVVIGLGVGLIILAPYTIAAENAAAKPLYWILITGIFVMVLAVICTVAFASFSDRLSAVLPATAARMIRGLVFGLRSLDRRVGGAVLALDLVIWSCELVATWFVIRSMGVDLTAGQTVVVLGAASLSTLLPTAPGFIGSYQLAFALSLDFFGAPRAVGIAAATLIQVFLLGSVTIIGLSIYFWHHIRKAVAPSAE